jgi:hypothetical protein
LTSSGSDIVRWSEVKKRRRSGREEGGEWAGTVSQKRMERETSCSEKVQATVRTERRCRRETKENKLERRMRRKEDSFTGRRCEAWALWPSVESVADFTEGRRRGRTNPRDLKKAENVLLRREEEAFVGRWRASVLVVETASVEVEVSGDGKTGDERGKDEGRAEHWQLLRLTPQVALELSRTGPLRRKECRNVSAMKVLMEGRRVRRARKKMENKNRRRKRTASKAHPHVGHGEMTMSTLL